MKTIVVLFPPKTKYSAELYFRAQQIVTSLRRRYRVEIEEGVSATGTTSDRRPFIVRLVLGLSRFPQLLRSINRSDAILIFPGPLWYFFIPVGRLMKKRIILDHFTTFLGLDEYINVPVISWLLRHLDSLVYRKIDAIITHTVTMAKQLRLRYRIGAEKIFVLYSVVDTDTFSAKRLNQASKTEARDELGIAKGQSVAMYHGAFHAFHGVETILKAAKLLENQPVTFLLLGDPPPPGTTPKNVIYKEYVPFADLPRYLSIADIWVGRFANPKDDIRGERMASSCMFQAMSMSLPVVTAESIESRTALDNGRAGLLLPPNDPEALAKTITHLLSDAGLRRRLGQVARTLIVERFSLCAVDRTIDQVLTSLETSQASSRKLK